MSKLLYCTSSKFCSNYWRHVSYFLFYHYYSLRVSAILDHFGYPPPLLNQWQQRIWYNLGAAQEFLHQMHNCLARGLPAITSPTRSESSLFPTEPASRQIHPSYGGKFVKASDGGSSVPGTATAGVSSFKATTPPKTEGKRKKKKK